MNEPVVFLYDDFDDADGARSALLDAGFAASRVHLTARHDEAGAVQSNFFIGNGAREAPGDEYQNDFAAPVQRAANMLEVEVGQEGERERATEIMKRFRPVDVDRALSGSSMGTGQRRL
jgi:hypothetical protein